MAASSVSSSSMLYRTSSTSTSASSTSQINVVDDDNHDEVDRHHRHASQDIDDVAKAVTMAAGKKKRRRKKKKKTNNVTDSMNDPSETSITTPPMMRSTLPGFVPATNLTKNRYSQTASPTTSLVATPSRDANVKGKEGLSTSDLSSDDEQEKTLLSANAPPAETNPQERHYLQVKPVNGTNRNGTHKGSLPSPAESEISSTDELGYVASPKLSPKTSPRVASRTTKSPQQKQQQHIPAPSPSYMTRHDASPFKPAVTGFDFLAAQNAAMLKIIAARANVPSVTLNSPGSPSLCKGAAGLDVTSRASGDVKISPQLEDTTKGLDSPFGKEEPEVLSIDQEPIPSYKPLSSPSLPNDVALKKVTASPLTWSNNHRVMDAPTLGSPTLDNIQDQDGTALSYAVTRASFAVSKDTILEQLNRKKEESKLLQSGSNLGLGFSTALPDWATDEDKLDMSMPYGGQRQNKRRDHHTDRNGIVRRDMAIPPPPQPGPQPEEATYDGPSSSSSGWQVQSPTPVANELHVAAMLDTASLQGITPAADTYRNGADGATSAAADVEDAFDDARSEASDTSLLIRNVTQDSDKRGWEALDEETEKSIAKARQRLSKAIHLLNKRHRPSQAVIDARREIIHQIRKKLNGMLPEWAPDFQYQIQTFGSTAYGLDTDNSDLDLCIMDPKRPDGFRNAVDLYDIAEESVDTPATTNGASEGQNMFDAAGGGVAGGMSTTEDDEDAAILTPFQRRKREKRQPWTNQKKTKLGLDPIYDVRRLGDTLKRIGFKAVTPIPNAIVPIVKFKSRDGICADMNANEQLGVRNSALLAEYISSSPIIRPFLIFLKIWAKKRGLNDPSGRHGPMSLSSYSLVLMGIGYLQHIGLVQNIQDLDLIKQRGVERQVFWTKIANKDAIRPHGYGRGKYLGDYRALAVDTTFVTSPRSQATHPSGQTKKRKSKNSGKQKEHVGWESESDSDTASSVSAKDTNPVTGKPLDVLELVEGFFDYYTGFPIESRVVSIWSGKPLKRTMGYMSPAGDSDGLLPQLPKISREEREELYEETVEEQGEELFHLVENVTANGMNDLEIAEKHIEQDNDPVSEDEAVRKFDEEIARRLAAMGVANTAPSFESTLKSPKVQAPKTSKAQIIPPSVSNGHNVNNRPSNKPQSISNIVNYAGLDASQASQETNLFPMPPLERPEDFVEPPTWTQRLVVQDPFIHTRNTCANIIPDMVDRIWQEMHRALEMVRAGAALDQICLSVRRDQSVSPMMRPHWKADKAVIEARRAAKLAHRKSRRELTPRRAQKQEAWQAKQSAKRDRRTRPETNAREHYAHKEA